MVDDYMVDKVLDKVKEIIGIEKIDDTKILIITDDQLSHNIILNRFAILLTCFMRDGNKFYPHQFLDHALYDE